MTTTRFATFNVHNGRPRTGRANMPLFIESVEMLRADVIGMQEVDNGMLRTRRVDMTALAAKSLGGGAMFSNARRRWDSGLYGNALVTTGAISNEEVLRYRRLRPFYERRIAQLATVEVNGTQWSVGNTHLSLHADEQVMHMVEAANALASRPSPRVLIGDFNLTPEVACSALEPLGWTVLKSTFTYPSWKPDHTVDFICVQGAVAEHVEVMSLPVSDHAALVADLKPE